jgi:chemotaxis protein MotC
MTRGLVAAALLALMAGPALAMAAGEEGVHAAGAVPQAEPVNAADIRKALPVATPLHRKLKLLRRAQDDIVRGQRQGAEDQRRLLGEMAALFESPDYWRLFTPADVTAIAAYVLSGGRPDVAERAAQLDSITAQDRRLLQGVAYYGRGLIREARDRLDDMETRQFPALLAGQITMVQGLIRDDTDYDRRLQLLERAMNSVPGTMVEEAALRRVVVLAAVRGDGAMFLRAARRYSARFAASLYAREYHDSLVASLARLAGALPPVDWVQADQVLAHEPREDRAEIYLGLARMGIAMGRADLCLHGGRRALRLAPEGSVPARQALLHVLACRVAQGDATTADLGQIDMDGLSSGDVSLWRAAQRMAAAMAAAPRLGRVVAAGEPPAPEAQAAAAATAMAKAAEILRRAKP